MSNNSLGASPAAMRPVSGLLRGTVGLRPTAARPPHPLRGTSTAGIRYRGQGSRPKAFGKQWHTARIDYFAAIDRSNAGGDGSEKSSEIGSDKSSEKILELLRAEPTMTIAALAQALSLSTRAVEKALKKLKAAGRIERIGPAKGGRRAVMGSANA